MYLTEAEFDLLAREAVETAIAELIDLKTLGRCPPEVFEQRVINLGGGRLVQLAHPDKHGGSPAAIEATRWLLENRPIVPEP